MFKSRKEYWALLSPALLTYVIAINLPILYSLILSLTDWSGFGTPNFVGIDNYVAAFRDPVFWFAVKNNGLIIFISIFIQIPLGFFLAFFLYRGHIKLPAFFESVIFFPTILSTVVVGLLFNSIFSSSSIVEQILKILLDDPLYRLNLYSSKHTAMLPILAVMVWMYSGTFFIIFLANMQRLPGEMIEAATMDGADEVEIMTKVVWPNLLPIALVCAILAITGSLKSFDLVWVMTEGGPSYYTEVMASYMFKHSMGYYQYGYGSAVAIITILSGILLITGLRKITGKFINEGYY